MSVLKIVDTSFTLRLSSQNLYNSFPLFDLLLEIDLPCGTPPNSGLNKRIIVLGSRSVKYECTNAGTFSNGKTSRISRCLRGKEYLSPVGKWSFDPRTDFCGGKSFKSV